jgi:hypothetical protein
MMWPTTMSWTHSTLRTPDTPETRATVLRVQPT